MSAVRSRRLHDVGRAALAALLALGLAGGRARATAGESAGATAGGSTAGRSFSAAAFPLSFESEVVRLFVLGDTLRVVGTYRLACRDGVQGNASLFYPYPEDERLGPARTVSLAARGVAAADGGPREGAAGRAGEGFGPWRPLDCRELAALPGARWRIPLDLCPRIEVRTVYEQVLRGRFARYIVTTTKAWQRPLRRARFEIHLPADCEPDSFSFPFEPIGQGDRRYFLFQTERFLPDRDVEVTWR